MDFYQGTYTNPGTIIPTTNSRNKKSARKKISYAEAMKNFIKPRPWQELSGTLGVELSEVAKGLNVRFPDFKRNLERSDFFEMAKLLKLKIVSFDTFNENGVLVHSYIIDEEAAEYLLAKSKSLLGYYYLRFLRQCRLAVKVLADEYQTLSKEYKRRTLNLSRPRLR
ncbi:MAG: hypothetical protein HRT70_07995 [Flavobacteriaceae bacterium]|nr:hypothetical protein [Flavobacteriaceae bacterium]